MRRDEPVAAAADAAHHMTGAEIHDFEVPTHNGTYGGLEWNRREHLHTLARTLSHANVATGHDGCADRVVTDWVLWSADASGYISIE